MNPESNSRGSTGTLQAAEQLVFRQLTDGTLSPEAFHEVEARLLADADYRARYLEFMKLEAVLAESLTLIPEPTLSGPQPVLRTSIQSPRRVPVKSLAAAGAVLIVALGAWQVITTQNRPQREIIVESAPAAVSPDSTPENSAPAVVETPVSVFTAALQRMPDVAVVTLLDATSARSSTPQLALGKRLKPGILRVPEGHVQLDFLCGARVVIDGPAELFLISPAQATLMSGSVAARVPEVARGFVLSGPKSAVVDLGTEFTMSVNQDEISEVHVVEGEVEVSLIGDDGNTLQSQVLEDDQTVRLSKMTDRVEQIQQPTVVLPHVGTQTASPLHVPEAYPRAVLNDGARIYWRFDRVEDDTVPNEAGPEFTGRIVGGNDPASGLEIANGQLNLAKSSKPRYVAADQLLPDLNTFSYSLELWVNPQQFHHGAFLAVFPANDPIAQRHLIVLEVAHNTSLVHLPGALRFLHRLPPRERGGLNLFSNEGCIPGQWHHMVAVKTRKELRLYVNGERIRAVDIHRLSDSQPYQLLLGELRTAIPERQFIGSLDEVAVYWRALSDEDVLNHYQLMQGTGMSD